MAEKPTKHLIETHSDMTDEEIDELVDQLWEKLTGGEDDADED